MATILGTLGVRVTASLGDFRKKMREVNNLLGESVKNAGKISAIGGAAFAGIALAAGKAALAASEQRQAELKLATALRASGKSADISAFTELAARMQDLTGQGDELTLSQAGLLTSFGASQESIEKLIPGIADYAAATGKNATRATIAFARALSGEATLIEPMIGNLTDLEKKTFDAATQQERAAFLSDKLGKSFGGTAEAMRGTFGGALEAVKGRFGDLIQEAGSFIDMPLVGVLNGIENATKGVINLLSEMEDETKANIVRFGAFTTAVIGLTAAIFGLSKAFQLLSANAKLIAAIAAPFLLVAGIIAGLILIVGAMSLAWKGNLGGIRELVSDFVEDVTDAFSKMKKSIVDTVNSIGETTIEIFAFATGKSADEAFAMIDAIRKAGGTSGIIAGAAGKASDVVGDVVGGAFKDVVGTFNEGLDTILGVFGFDIDKIGEKFGLLGETSDDTGGSFKGVGDAAEGAGKALKKVKSAAVAAAEAAGKAPRQESNLGEAIQTKVTGSLSKMFESIAPTIGDAAAGAITSGLGTAFAVIAPAVQQGGENISAAMKGAAEGFKAGGPMGAIIGAIAALATKTQAFKDILNIFNQALQPVVDLLQEILQPLVGMTRSLVQFGDTTRKVVDAVSFLGPVLKLFAFVTNLIAEILSEIVKGIAFVFNKILDGLINIVEGIFFGAAERKLRNSLNRAKIDVSKFKTSQEEEKEEEEEELAEDLGGLGDEVDDATKSISNMSIAARKVSDQFTNVAKGFKLTFRRFQSITSAGEDIAPGGLAGRLAEAKADRVVNINIFANDSREVAKKVTDELETRQFQVKGTSFIGQGAFQVPRKGS